MEGKARGTRLVEFDKLGSLSSDDGNGNENCKKAIGLDNKTTNMHLHHRPFLYIYLPSLQDTTYKCLISRLFFFSGTIIQCLRIELQKNLPTFDISKEIKKKKREKVRCSVYSLSLSDVFVAVAVNCRRCCLNSLIS